MNARLQRAVRYAKRTHPNKSWSWLKSRYWGKLNAQRQDNRVFGDKHTGWYLLKFSWFAMERHVLVRAQASPDDPRLRDYWRRRNLAKAGRLDARKRRLAQRQQGLCWHCGMSLFNDEELHIHHRVVRACELQWIVMVQGRIAASTRCSKGFASRWSLRLTIQQKKDMWRRIPSTYPANDIRLTFGEGARQVCSHFPRTPFIE